MQLNVTSKADAIHGAWLLFNITCASHGAPNLVRCNDCGWSIPNTPC